MDENYRRGTATDPGDEADRLAREIWEWFKAKFHSSTFAEIAAIVTNVLLAFAGLAALLVYRDQLSEMRKTTEAARSAAQTAATQLDFSYRPWVYTDFDIISPLIFDKAGGQVQIKLATRNEGTAPAVQGQLRAELYLPHSRGRSIAQERAEFCFENTTWGGGDGWAMLPKEKPIEEVYTLTRRTDEVEEAIRNSLASDHRFAAFLIVCTDYGSVSPPRRFHTNYVYWLVHREPGGEFTPGFSPNESVSAKNLAVTKTGGGAGIEVR